MWTPTSRQQHNRAVTRYQTDLTDAEWRVIAPQLPKPCATGRPREWPMREIGLPVAAAAKRPVGGGYRWFAAWRDDGRLKRDKPRTRDGGSGTGRARRQPHGGNHR